MGMYNEVYKRCPVCGGLGLLQIPQIVLGFGKFDLETKDNIGDLNYEDKKLLVEYTKDEYFKCQSCDHRFRVNVIINDKPTDTVII